MNAPDRIEALRLKIEAMPNARRTLYSGMLKAALALDADRQGEALKAISLRVTRAEVLDTQRMMTRGVDSGRVLH